MLRLGTNNDVNFFVGKKGSDLQNFLSPLFSSLIHSSVSCYIENQPFNLPLQYSCPWVWAFLFHIVSCALNPFVTNLIAATMPSFFWLQLGLNSAWFWGDITLFFIPCASQLLTRCCPNLKQSQAFWFGTAPGAERKFIITSHHYATKYDSSSTRPSFWPVDTLPLKGESFVDLFVGTGLSSFLTFLPLGAFWNNALDYGGVTEYTTTVTGGWVSSIMQVFVGFLVIAVIIAHGNILLCLHVRPTQVAPHLFQAEYDRQLNSLFIALLLMWGLKIKFSNPPVTG